MTEKALESLMKTENVEMVWAALHQKEIDPAEVETLVRLYVDKLEARLKFREAGRVLSRVASTEEEKKACIDLSVRANDYFFALEQSSSWKLPNTQIRNGVSLSLSI